METTTIRSLYESIPTCERANTNVSGWVRTMRDSKTLAFIELNDGTYFRNLQIILEESKLNNYKELVKAIGVGAAISVTGTILPTPEMKQPFELHADEVEIVGLSTPDFPLQKKRHTLEYLRTIAHLRPRANLFQAVFRIRSLTAQAIHRFFHENGFVYVHTPLITGSDCEGAGEMFHVTTLDMANPPRNEDGTVDYTQDFFGKPVSL
ncbi:MAG: asparagine--tRNA ligase, partial [Clostridia bacterium]|nr:asparagine--tRNA ligase [Clostridia bacterium]